MEIIAKKLAYSTTYASFILLLLLLLPFVDCSSHSIKHNNQKVNHQMTSDIAVHGLLLWASMGLLMPLGILAIRMSNRQECRRWFKLLFYFHTIFQTLSVLLATAGAALSLRSFENSFNNHHQRVGLALYVAIWVQALIGFRRPKRGRKGRSLWYFVHWGFGTAITLVGIFNIYTGLEAYHKRTRRSTRLWTILFTAQIFFMTFFYLLQDKWDYIQKQGIILGTELALPPPLPPPPPPSDHHQVIPPQRENHKDLLSSNGPCRKSNSLGNYFAKSNPLKKLFQLT